MSERRGTIQNAIRRTMADLDIKNFIVAVDDGGETCWVWKVTDGRIVELNETIARLVRQIEPAADQVGFADSYRVIKQDGTEVVV